MLPVLPEGKESFSADFSSLYVYFTKAHKLSDWCNTVSVLKIRYLLVLLMSKGGCLGPDRELF